jgi:hypothetical protein
VEQPAPSPADFAPRVSPELEAICLRALRKKPEDRFQTAREMRAELRAALGGASSGKVSDPPPPPPPRSATTLPPTAKSPRGAVPTLVMVLVAVVLAAGVAFLAWRGQAGWP